MEEGVADSSAQMVNMTGWFPWGIQLHIDSSSVDKAHHKLATLFTTNPPPDGMEIFCGWYAWKNSVHCLKIVEIIVGFPKDSKCEYNGCI